MPELPEVEATRHLTGRMLTAARRRGKLIWCQTPAKVLTLAST
jgi:formamidopyrimidine-DNA glycosylase